MLTAQDLTIGYRPVKAPPLVVAQDLAMTLQAGELVCLIGPNGAGKSTLMRTLVGMQPPLAGTVHLDGDDVHALTPRARALRLGVVLTDRLPVGLLSAYTLVGLGRFPHTGWTGTLTEADHAVVEASLQAVGATPLAHRHVADLSDGERQKVLLARALAQEPRLLVLDEITAFLDLPRRVEIMQLLRHLARTTGRAVLLSTHDLDLALRSADRIWLLAQDGSLKVGAPEDLVLSGAFEAAFASEGVDFDRERGTFQIHQDEHLPVHVQGEGAARYWTQHALEREGCRVATPEAPATLHVTVTGSPEALRWTLRLPEGPTQSVGSLLALAQAVRVWRDQGVVQDV
ncbi:MAG: ABC transporter ATP-binding protein [Bacteroidota bacterium]